MTTRTSTPRPARRRAAEEAAKPTTVEVLQKALKLIRRGWCKGVSARDRRDMPISPHDAAASKFCSLGAVRRIIGPGADNDPMKEALSETMVCRDVADWNDAPSRCKSDVIAAFRATIARELLRGAPRAATGRKGAGK